MNLSARLTPQAGFYLLFAILTAWSLAAVMLVNVDLFDGYSTIANSQYYLGLSPEYFWQRSPALAWWLIPAEWLARFPSGEQIIARAVELYGCRGADPDTRLLRRRDCEFRVFRSLERACHLPRIQQGFKTVESFLGLAQTLLQSRKSRAGNSLELHLRRIFEEEGLDDRKLAQCCRAFRYTLVFMVVFGVQNAAELR